MSASHVPDNGHDVLLEITDLKKHFPVTKGIVFKRTVAQIKAVDGVSFEVLRGEVLGLRRLGLRGRRSRLGPRDHTRLSSRSR